MRASTGASGALSCSVAASCPGSRSWRSATSSRTMLPAIVRRPSPRICANQRRISLPVRPTGPPTITRSPLRRPLATGAVAYAVVRQRCSGPSRSSAASEVTTLVVEASRNGWSALNASSSGASAPSTARTSNPKLLAGRPEPRRIAETAGGRALRRAAGSRRQLRGRSLRGRCARGARPRRDALPMRSRRAGTRDRARRRRDDRDSGRRAWCNGRPPSMHLQGDERPETTTLAAGNPRARRCPHPPIRGMRRQGRAIAAEVPRGAAHGVGSDARAPMPS